MIKRFLMWLKSKTLVEREKYIYEPWSDRVFKMDPNLVPKILNEASERSIQKYGFVSMNDLYDALCPKRTEAGYHLVFDHIPWFTCTHLEIGGQEIFELNIEDPNYWEF